MRCLPVQERRHEQIIHGQKNEIFGNSKSNIQRSKRMKWWKCVVLIVSGLFVTQIICNRPKIPWNGGMSLINLYNVFLSLDHGVAFLSVRKWVSDQKAHATKLQRGRNWQKKLYNLSRLWKERPILYPLKGHVTNKKKINHNFSLKLSDAMWRHSHSL